MALYNMNPEPSIIESNADEYNRTQTNLIKDEGDAPSGRKAVDPRLEKKFKFHFGGQNGWVVIPKGRIVAIDPDFERKSFDDEMYYNVATLANGGKKVTEANPDGEDYVRAANKPAGVSTVNVYEDIDDSFRGNVPVYYTRSNINLPYFALKADAEKTEWGSVYGPLKPGDKVMADENGRFVKWKEGKLKTEVKTSDASGIVDLDVAIFPGEAAEDFAVVTTADGTAVTVTAVDHKAGQITVDATDTEVEVTYRSVLSNAEQIVGQVQNLNAHVNDGMVNYAGWLKWVMPEGKYVDASGYRPEDLSADGHPYDPQYFEGFDDKTMAPTGIPGLTDGYNITVPYADKPLGTIPENMAEGESFNFRVLPTETPILRETVVVKFDGVDVTADVVEHIDADAGLIMIKLDAANATAAGETVEVTVDFSAKQQLAGLPSQYDFSGVYGDADILLQL
jgi:hypothetical protein